MVRGTELIILVVYVCMMMLHNFEQTLLYSLSSYHHSENEIDIKKHFQAESSTQSATAPVPIPPLPCLSIFIYPSIPIHSFPPVSLSLSLWSSLASLKTADIPLDNGRFSPRSCPQLQSPGPSIKAHWSNNQPSQIPLPGLCCSLLNANAPLKPII